MMYHQIYEISVRNQREQCFMTKPMVYILDDDKDVVELVSILLNDSDFTIRKYTDPRKMIADFDGRLEGCLLLDYMMPELSGLGVLEKIKGWLPLFPVVLLTGHADVPTTLSAMKIGAFDLLEKPVAGPELLAMVGNALAWSKNIRLKNLESVTVWAAMQSLSCRELEVLDLILAGCASRDIGKKLKISRFTADHHRANILSKLELPTIGALLTAVTRAKTLFESDSSAVHATA
jgi:two-component system, LuxR family, response regulator FixJ